MQRFSIHIFFFFFCSVCSFSLLTHSLCFFLYVCTRLSVVCFVYFLLFEWNSVLALFRCASIRISSFLFMQYQWAKMAFSFSDLVLPVMYATFEADIHTGMESLITERRSKYAVRESQRHINWISFWTLSQRFNQKGKEKTVWRLNRIGLVLFLERVLFFHFISDL